ncbi:myosin-13-like [Rosa chinensis]|uniref:myosin-13-like n=1 Tax=Rosa chinensis TaxID=74649 RepID=UPI000D08BA03|nr:myosin-13-like [Rosa chinensis]
MIFCSLFSSFCHSLLRRLPPQLWLFLQRHPLQPRLHHRRFQFRVGFCLHKPVHLQTHPLLTTQQEFSPLLQAIASASRKSELTCVIVEFLKVVSLQEFASILEPNLCKIVSSLRLYLRLPLIAGLAKLEHWCYETTDEYAGSAWMNSSILGKSLDFWSHQKPRKTLDEISYDLFPLVLCKQGRSNTLHVAAENCPYKYFGCNII